MLFHDARSGSTFGANAYRVVTEFVAALQASTLPSPVRTTHPPDHSRTEKQKRKQRARCKRKPRPAQKTVGPSQVLASGTVMRISGPQVEPAHACRPPWEQRSRSEGRWRCRQSSPIDWSTDGVLETEHAADGMQIGASGSANMEFVDRCDFSTACSPQHTGDYYSENRANAHDQPHD